MPFIVDYKTKAEELMRKEKTPHDFYYKALKGLTEKELKPLKKGDIPKIAVLLGLLDPFFFDLYTMCDGDKTIDNLSNELDISSDIMKIFVDKLIKNGLVEIRPKL